MTLVQATPQTVPPHVHVADAQPKTGGTSPGGNRIALVQAKDHTGNRAYYFLLLNPLRQPQFKKAVAARRSFDLDEYGEVIASGYGDVPELVRERIRAQYGWKG